MTLQIVTANRLADGLVVYLDAGGGWSARLGDARVTETETEALMAIAAKAERQRIVVGPYLIDVVKELGGLSPVRLREAIRASGPTVPAGQENTDVSL